MTLNYFKTLYMILTKLGAFVLVSLWHVLMFAARELTWQEISYLMNIKIFLSLLNWLYIIKRKFKCLLNMYFIALVK